MRLLAPTLARTTSRALPTRGGARHQASLPRYDHQKRRRKLFQPLSDRLQLKKFFSFEVTILDDKHIRRRFRASTYQTATRVKPFICTMPMRLDEAGTRFSSTCPISLAVLTVPTMLRRSVCRFTPTVALEGMYLRRASFHPSVHPALCCRSSLPHRSCTVSNDK